MQLQTKWHNIKNNILHHEHSNGFGIFEVRFIMALICLTSLWSFDILAWWFSHCVAFTSLNPTDIAL